MMTLGNRLSGLESSGLIRLAQIEPEIEYLFRHALVQDAAYESLLKQDRKLLHRLVGETLERMYPDSLAENAARLAHHFDEAQDYERALKYFTRAGDAAYQSSANIEAVEHYGRAVEIAQQRDVSSARLTHIFSHLGRAFELISNYKQALMTYRQMDTLAQQRGDRHMELIALTGRVILFTTLTPVYEPERGEALAQHALALAHDLNDKAAMAKIYWSLLNLYRFTNRLSQAIESGERSLKLARELDMREQMAYSLNDVAFCYFVAGWSEQAIEALNEASDLWRELNNLAMLTDSLATSSAVRVYTGNYDQALSLSEESFQIAQRIDNLWGQSYSREIIGYAHWERGRPDRAIAVMQESIHLSDAAGFLAPQLLTRSDLALVYGSLGAIERAMELAHLSLAVAEKHLPAWRVYPLGALARLHLLNGNIDKAKAVIARGNTDPNREAAPILFVQVRLAEAELELKQANYKRVVALTNSLLDDLRQWNMRSRLPQTLYLKGQALFKLGNDDVAHTHLAHARDVAEEIDSRRSLWPILHSLSTIEQHRNNRVEAEALRQQANEIVRYIAKHIDSVTLRDSFLSKPDVLALLDT